MRIAILTQPLRYNYGGILQNYALQTVLREMGHDVVTLDPPRYFYPKWKYSFVFLRHAAARYLKGHPEVSIFAEYFQDKITKILGANTFRFIDTYIQRKEYKDSYKDIKECDYDAFVVGSDQTWRYRYNHDRIYDMFLCFTKGWSVERFAYAASFGTNKWEGDEETTRKCREAIHNFDLVTVRESSGLEICRSIFEADAHHVLDPTLLLNREDYMNLTNSTDYLDTKEGDLYLYILDENEETKKLAEDIAKYKGLKPYSYHSKFTDLEHSRSIEEHIQPPVELWLKGFEQAHTVITDSFHACVFSIIFRKQFYLYGNKVRGMDRYTSLFNMLGIGNRMVRTIEDAKNLQDIDYDMVYDILRDLQYKSLNILKNHLV